MHRILIVLLLILSVSIAVRCGQCADVCLLLTDQQGIPLHVLYLDYPLATITAHRYALVIGQDNCQPGQNVCSPAFGTWYQYGGFYAPDSPMKLGVQMAGSLECPGPLSMELRLENPMMSALVRGVGSIYNPMTHVKTPIVVRQLGKGECPVLEEPCNND